MKKQEHVQFTEYLSMDRYKHCTAGQKLQRPNRTNKIPAKAGDSKDKPVANGVGNVNFFAISSVKYVFIYN